jgi:signal peptidase I
MLGIYKVSGNSMLPEMMSGDYVLCFKSKKAVRIGVDVIVEHHRYGTLLSKIKKIDPRGYVWLASNSEFNTEVLRLGWVSPEEVLGRVIYRIKHTNK